MNSRTARYSASVKAVIHGFRRPVITAIAGRERPRRTRSSAPPFSRMQKRRDCSRPGPVADLEEARLGAAHHLPPPTTGEPRRRRSRDVVDDREDPGAHLRGARVQEEIGRNEAIGCAVVDDVPGLGRRGSPSHLHGRGRRAWRRSGAATRRATSSPGHHADLGAEDRGERHDGPQLRVRLCREQATDRRVVPVCVSRELRLRQPGLDPATQRTPPDHLRSERKIAGPSRRTRAVPGRDQSADAFSIVKPAASRTASSGTPSRVQTPMCSSIDGHST